MKKEFLVGVSAVVVGASPFAIVGQAHASSMANGGQVDIDVTSGDNSFYAPVSEVFKGGVAGALKDMKSPVTFTVTTAEASNTVYLESFPTSDTELFYNGSYDIYLVNEGGEPYIEVTAYKEIKEPVTVTVNWADASDATTFTVNAYEEAVESGQTFTENLGTLVYSDSLAKTYVLPDMFSEFDNTATYTVKVEPNLNYTDNNQLGSTFNNVSFANGTSNYFYDSATMSIMSMSAGLYIQPSVKMEGQFKVTLVSDGGNTYVVNFGVDSTNVEGLNENHLAEEQPPTDGGGTEQPPTDGGDTDGGNTDGNTDGGNTGGDTDGGNTGGDTDGGTDEGTDGDGTTDEGTNGGNTDKGTDKGTDGGKTDVVNEEKVSDLVDAEGEKITTLPQTGAEDVTLFAGLTAMLMAVVTFGLYSRKKRVLEQ